MGNSQTQQSDMPILNEKYEIISLLGTGKTAMVYLGRTLKEPHTEVALKILKKSHVKKKDQVYFAKTEMQIHSKLKHENIVKMFECGEKGKIRKPNGSEVDGLYYLVLEYVPQGILYDVVENFGGVGEDGGRFFAKQLVSSVKYLTQQNVAHRDLKLENILVNAKMQIKLSDFGFATDMRSQLSAYGGTQSYMAPEVIERKKYDGHSSDIFSLGVIIFLLVIGSFPFPQACASDKYYSLLMKEHTQRKYWKAVGASKYSEDFKSLAASMLSYDPNQRPTIYEIESHPWMTQQCDSLNIQNKLIKEMDWQNQLQSLESSENDQLAE